MEYRWTNGLDKEFAYLCAELDKNLDELVGNKFDRKAQYDQYNQRDEISDVIIAFEQNEPVGCAALKMFNAETAEIKRVFVLPQYRGCGVSKKMLRELERRAKAQGYKKLILETGELLVASMGLYKSLGYVITENYGQYIGMSHSVCMAKSLKEKLSE